MATAGEALVALPDEISRVRELLAAYTGEGGGSPVVIDLMQDDLRRAERALEFHDTGAIVRTLQELQLWNDGVLTAGTTGVST